ncbi:MAG: NAD(P)/FAD-dependent oxidoreductase [Desulfobacterota bacterium]|nr:NAD(P)/FAD-dependent oxidoreductase [Thermodesulfobacteriota bacterium]
MIAFDILIIGAGVVGLAIAAHVAQRFSGNSIAVLERHGKFGQETSSRNSEVIHAGIYYPSGSLKARLCVAGNRMLYDFCRAAHVPHQRTGKLILAADAPEMETIRTLFQTGTANGIDDLKLIDGTELRRMEPQVTAWGALYSPSTGIIDSHQLMARLEARALSMGAVIAYQHDVINVVPGNAATTVLYRAPSGSEERLTCRWFVNAAGLGAQHIAASMGIDCDTAGYRLFFCKGEYFFLRNPAARNLKHLIYPPPFKDLRGLGIHITRSLDGTVRLGPNAVYVDRLDYSVDPAHAKQFYESIQPYLPFVSFSDLQPDMAGIRPKLQGPGETFRDFVICHEHERGLPGIINLIGIESPGLTACLSIAETVGDMIAAAW